MEVFSWIAILAALLMGIFLGRRRTIEGSKSKPSVEHKVEVEVMSEDILAEAIEEHAQHGDVDPETVRNAIDLADATRKRF